MEKDEILIIKACKKGDLKQFSALYEKYIKKIYDFVYYKTHHKETAEDICSLVFVKALNSIKTFDLKKGTFQAFLYQVARNTVIDHYRTKKENKNIDDIWDLADGEDLERDIDTKNKLVKIEKYLKTLKIVQRDIIIMRVWQGMSYKEIADVLKKSESSCKMTYSRAIRKLREDMPPELFMAFITTLLF